MQAVRRIGFRSWIAGVLIAVLAVAARAEEPGIIQSAGSGAWSDQQTWEGGKVPAAGAKVLVRTGHRVVYDVASDAVLRAVHVSGTLSFATDRDTRLDVGLLMVRPGEKVTEDGIGTAAVGGHAHHEHDHGDAPAGTAKPALEIGTADAPVDAKHTATIRLTYVEGMDKDTCPALVASGGRMDLFGAPMSRTWLKLGQTAKAGDSTLTLAEPVTGWKAGDKLVVVATNFPDFFLRDREGVAERTKDNTETEERTIKTIGDDGKTLTLDAPLKYEHAVINNGEFAGEVANLTRNVVIESADAKGVRGHTMYHRGSTGSIAYAEFRHLGKEGALGRYPIHYHEVGDTMRGSSVIGASVWESGNRWVTIHGTDYMVVRDVVGYQSIGHGFFCEDGTEVYNVFDRNLAVQAYLGKPLPQQVLGFDKNDGGGFWWANSLNSFTRNVAAECDQHGFRYEVIAKNATFDPVLKVRQGDGTKAAVDVRTLPFIRFDDNEAHSHRRFGLNLGGMRALSGKGDYKDASTAGTSRPVFDDEKVKEGDVGGVGPDRRHPFVIRDFKAWTSHWAYHSGTPSVMVDGMKVYDSNYGLWRSNVRLTSFKNVSFAKMRRVDIFNPFGGNQSLPDDYDKAVGFTDDFAPVTVVTRVSRAANGDVTVRGTTADNGEVVKVLVNGKEAKATTANFAEWEVALSGADAQAASLTVGASDKAGNAEKTPHVVALGAGVARAAAAE